MFAHRKVLVVDDDIRNVYAMTALLESRGIEVVIAENGQQALDELAQSDDIDLVFMDVMMPVMDGLEAMRRIRHQPQFKSLPIITLTAKALPEDRNKAIEAGATDYLPKPLNADKLLSLLRVWLE
jgi:CheY-like chemotaxis protein